jgi:hypothetical protein
MAVARMPPNASARRPHLLPLTRGQRDAVATAAAAAGASQRRRGISIPLPAFAPILPPS